MSTTSGARVRLARPDEFPEVTKVMQLAFAHDAVFNYFGNVDKLIDRESETKESRAIYAWDLFLLKACYAVGGRITVAVKDAQSTSDTERGKKEIITAAAFWLPPNKRLSLWLVGTLIRSGMFKVIGRWGLRCLQRIAFEYLDCSHDAMLAGYKTKGLKESPDASWYLQLVGTHPKYEGQGMLSLLMRESFAHTGPTTYTLEATSQKSRDRYAHYGFEVVTTFKIGVGKVDGLGLRVSKKDAVGVELYSMILKT